MGKSGSRRRRRNQVRSQGFWTKGLRPNRRCFFEPLEARQLLSASKPVALEGLINDKSGDVRQVIGPLAAAAPLFPEVEQAFARVSRLGQYSQERLQQAERWVIHTAYELSATELAIATGAPALEVFSGITNTFIYDVEHGETARDVASYFANSELIDYFYPLVPLRVATKAVTGDVPDNPDDPLLPQQWHLINTGQQVGNPDDLPIFSSWGEDIRIEPVWENFTGKGVVIAIVDDGVQINHPDLAANFSLALSKDVDGGDNNPSPNTNLDFHGTAVAGLAAASGNNGEGVTGVAFDATLAGIRVLSRAGLTDEDIFNALNHLNDEIDIYNNSFGPADSIRNVDAFGPMAIQALRLSAFLGRGGLGNIHVTAAGNGAGPDVFDNSNFDGFANSRFSIAVGAVDHDGIGTEYSEGGSNVFLVGPSGTQATVVEGTDFTRGSGMVTTDLMGDFGYNATGISNDQIGRDFLADIDYTSRFNGTSASTPVVSGVVALMLEANPNLTYRDVEHILARSSRKNDPFDIGWFTNWDGIFVDPALDPDTGLPIVFVPNDPMDPMAGFMKERFREIDNSFLPFPPAASALPDPVPRIANGLGYIPGITNSAGFSVHDRQEIAYGHGVVDARLAVTLAQNWQRVPIESAIIRPRVRLSQQAGTIAGRVQIPDTQIFVPGGISPPPNSDTEEFFNLWFNLPDDPEEPPDEPPLNGRGFEIPIFVPDTLAVEWVEVELGFRDLPEDVSDNLRITLVSPEGTHSDFVNWVPEEIVRDPWNPVPGDPMDPTQADVCMAAPDSIFCPSSSTEFTWTFTTMRHWGERTGTDLVNPETMIPQSWRLVFQNWNGSEANLETFKVDFYGVRVPEARIQGIVGLDANGDEDFNFTGLINFDTGDFVRDLETEEPMFIQFQPDRFREPLASEAIVYVDLNLDGDRDANEPFFMTGADGNYYFDLPFGTYDIGIEPPPGTSIVGDRTYTVQLGFDPAAGEVITRARDRNFLVTPAPITIEGRVFADFDGNGRVDPSDAGVQNFIAFADTNENGVFDFIDSDFNLRFDPDVDTPIDPIGETGPGGEYSITLDTTSNLYGGTEFYTIMLAEREGWSPTNPVRPFHRLFVRAGDLVEDIDFLARPEVSVIAGTVFQDLDRDGVRDTNEDGLAGFTVYLDVDRDGKLGIGEPSVVTTSTGTYSFTDIEPGSYTVRLVQVPAWQQIRPANAAGYTVDLPAGTVLPGRDFALNNLATHDFGDAPPPYPTTLADDGARHKILTGFFLGEGIDGELGDGSDEGAVGNDDDGVQFVDGPTLRPGTSKTITVTASRAGGYLQAWFDFNRDGDWDDPGERVITNRLLSTGPNSLTISVPESAVGGTTYARFRYGEFGINSVRGVAQLGEVEDYALEIMVDPPHPADINGDGVVSSADGDVIRQNLGTTGATREQGDVDGDGDVDADDLLDWLLNQGTGFVAAASAAASPAAFREGAGQPGFGEVGSDLQESDLGGGRVDRPNQFVGAGFQVNSHPIQVADAIRFDLALTLEGDTVPLPLLEVTPPLISGGKTQSELSPTQVTFPAFAQKDAALADFSESTLRKQSKVRSSLPSTLEWGPREVDLALAATWNDESKHAL